MQGYCRRGGCAVDVLAAPDCARPETREMRRHELDVVERDPRVEQPLDTRDERNFGCVGGEVEHALGGEQRSALDAVQASHQVTVLPDFEAHGLTAAVEFDVGIDHFWQDPSAALSAGGATLHHGS